jgi:hypothetical protein
MGRNLACRLLFTIPVLAGVATLVLGRVAIVCLAGLILMGPPMAAQDRDLGTALDRIGERVRAYYERFQRIVCTETLEHLLLGRDLMPNGRARRFTFELRLEAETAAEGRVDFRASRVLQQVNGRRAPADQEPQCMDPDESFSESMAFLLPENRDDHAFKWAGQARVQGVQARLIDYAPTVSETPQVTWTDDCFKVRASGHSGGRVWVDASTFEVLQISSRLLRPMEFEVPKEHRKIGVAERLRLERSDSTIRYRRITFKEPDETVLLPVSIETLTVIDGAGVPRYRTRQAFTDYRRFLTDARVRP